MCENTIRTVYTPLPVIHYIPIIISDQWFLLSSREDMNTSFVHCQPKVFGQSGCVTLHHFKYGGAIQRPLGHKGHVRFVAFSLRNIRVLSVLGSYVFRPNPLSHVLGYIALYDVSMGRVWSEGAQVMWYLLQVVHKVCGVCVVTQGGLCPQSCQMHSFLQSYWELVTYHIINGLQQERVLGVVCWWHYLVSSPDVEED